METMTIEVEESRRRKQGNSDAPPRKVKRAKLIITLKRSKDFKENMRKFNDIKEKNQKFMEAEKAKREQTKQ